MVLNLFDAQYRWNLSLSALDQAVCLNASIVFLTFCHVYFIISRLTTDLDFFGSHKDVLPYVVAISYMWRFQLNFNKN